ncbi:erythroid differentiation-related factor 1 [Holotrichia oblita]|uniref:Erythroid differentiation-related factor 1 n=1 Tax=Holotrichia oblita TaxID=644536 RepID=A0ACB9SZC9_HOLOL|nr:erythroid differentiation-related factor 1 [Holotrichia oblita]
MSDEEEDNKNEVEIIKSTAVVKYSVPKPARFTKLQCNTDLKLPPSNWLSSSADSYGLQHVLHQPKGFTSFRMAHMFPDCVGEVDVVSDSENIKKLLKIPYHKGHISMMEKSLVSKFLYHSLVQSEGEETFTENEHSKCSTVQGPLLPEPSPSEEVPDPSSFSHQYNRNVVWTFEDIDMLIGTDLPIFGGGTHPCISLRLSEMNKPINVLTGIDYWLDNLMSNVPEVVMCYHLNGIVQKYEFVKTEDLPRMDNSKFSPKLIRDVAQSILSFLKSNATKAGHTYWLFKGKDEEVIKLYDLTSLCSDQTIDNDQNPFIVPVAMLLYRVARNMKTSSDRRQPGTIRMLLKNCIKLLTQEKYAEIVTSSHYMLSDLYIPANTNPDNPELDHSDYDDAESVYDDDLDDDKKDCATKVLILNTEHRQEKFDNYYKPPPPIQGSLEERCIQGILHTAAGLDGIKYFHQEDQKEKPMEDNVTFAKPNEPIPMPYSKINEVTTTAIDVQSNRKGKKKDKSKKKVKVNSNMPLLLKNNQDPLPHWQESINRNISWKDHLKTLLYEKSVLIYAILAENYFVTKAYGSSLRVIGILVRCLQILSELRYPSNCLKENCVLGRAGDCCIMIIQNWKNIDKYNEQLQNQGEEDLKILEQIEADERLYDVQSSSYLEADGIHRRLGNALNEIGSFYLNKAKNSREETMVVELCKKAETYLKQGLDIFEKVKDDANTALLYTNMGHLHRLLAHISIPTGRGELTSKEKYYYNKSFEFYKKALQVLGERKHSPNIWDAVKWELSTALFTMGCTLHENPPSDVNIAEAEKEIIETLQKALQYCDFDKQNPKYPLYQYRAAMIHYRIGSLYHSHIWNATNTDVNRRNIIQLAKINYEKSAKLYLVSCDAENYLTAQMQKVSLEEFLAETTTVSHLRLKHYRKCLDIILELKSIVQMVLDHKIDIPEDDTKNFKERSKESSYKNCSALFVLGKQRLQFVLRHLIKLCLSKPLINKDCAKYTDIYKNSYSLTFELENCTEFDAFIKKFDNVLTKIGNYVSDINSSKK